MNRFMCTIGPSTCNIDTIKSLYEHGMSGIRFNMSHIDFSIEEIFDDIKILKEQYGYNILTYMDLRGPEIRVITENNIDVRKDQEVIIGKDFQISCNNFSKLMVGDYLYISDGQVVLQAKEITDSKIICKNIVGGEIKNNRNFYSERINKQLPFLSEKDLYDIDLAIKLKFDYLIPSFIRSREDIDLINKIISEAGSPLKVVAKIETKEAVENIDEIISACNVIMIGRGDLGVAFPLFEIPVLQKYIARKVKKANKKLIIATGFLESMKKHRIPERAEVCDLYNSFLDGADEIMFSGEVATSVDPVMVLITATKVLDTLDHIQYEKL